MTKTIFKKIMESDRNMFAPVTPKTITHETEACTLPELLEDFENFLKGVGYQFDGHLDIVQEE